MTSGRERESSIVFVSHDNKLFLSGCRRPNVVVSFVGRRRCCCGQLCVLAIWGPRRRQIDCFPLKFLLALVVGGTTIQLSSDPIQSNSIFVSILLHLTLLHRRSHSRAKIYYLTSWLLGIDKSLIKRGSQPGPFLFPWTHRRPSATTECPFEPPFGIRYTLDRRLQTKTRTVEQGKWVSIWAAEFQKSRPFV